MNKFSKSMISFLAVTAFFFLVQGISVSALEGVTGAIAEGEFEYIVEAGDTITITHYSGSNGIDLVIPDSFAGKPVTKIGDKAFSLPTTLTRWQFNSITFPNQLEAIGEYAMEKVEVPELALPNSVIELGEGSFKNTKIGNVTFPENLTMIGDHAFTYSEIENLNLGNVETVGVVSFAHSTITNLNLGNRVKTLESGSFRHTTITNLDLGNSLETIGSIAFTEAQLPNVTIPSSVTEINTKAFFKATIPNLEINGTNLTIGVEAFKRINNLQSLTLNEGVTTISGRAFEDSGISNLRLPESLGFIDYNAFSLNNLTEIIIPSNVEDIGLSAFSKNNFSKVVMQPNNAVLQNDIFILNQTADIDIYGHTGSYAEDFANTYGYTFIPGEGVISHDTNGSTGVNTSVDITLFFDNLNPTGMSEYTWSESADIPINGWIPFNSGDTIQSPDEVSGEYFVHVIGTDLLGLQVHETFGGFALDSTAPEAPTFNAVVDWTNSDVVVGLIDGVDEHSEIDRTEYRVDHGPWVVYTGEFTVADEGETTIEARSFDEANNESEMTVFNIKIDKTKPELNIELNQAEDGFIITASDSLSGVVEITLPNGDVIQSDEATFKFDGPGVYEFKVVDVAGNETIGSFEIEGVAPEKPGETDGDEDETDDTVTPEDPEGTDGSEEGTGDGQDEVTNGTEDDDMEDNKLPKTATNTFNLFAVGIGSLVIGLIIFYFIRRRALSIKR